MSRSYGKTQRDVLALLRRSRNGLTTTAIARAVYGEATPAARVAVRRGAERLVEDKKIEERPRLSARGDKRWALKRKKQARRKPGRRIQDGADELPGVDGSPVPKPPPPPVLRTREDEELDEVRYFQHLREIGDLPPDPPTDDDLPMDDNLPF